MNLRTLISSILCRLRPADAIPKVTAIYISTARGEPMQVVSQVTAIAGLGLQGDRYLDGNGYWRSIEACQITFITEHELSQAAEGSQIDLHNGSHRRNIVISNIRHVKLVEQRFSIGEAIFEYHKPRPPCGYLDKIAGVGIGKALAKRGGFCVRVIQGGNIKIGDSLKIN